MSNVIKQPGAREAAHRLRHGVIKRSVVEARVEAERIHAEAAAAAAQVREAAAAEARELRERVSRGTREAALSEFIELLLEARERRDRALAEVEQDVLRLSVRIAEKVIGREIARDDTALADIVATALRHARQHESLSVRVNPADLQLVQAHRERIDGTVRARFIDFVPDPRVRSGGCIVESEAGTVDAALDTQLRVLERALLARTTSEARKS